VPAIVLSDREWLRQRLDDLRRSPHDDDAWIDFDRRFHRRLAGYLRKLGWQWADAEPLVNETLQRARECVETLDPSQSVVGWLYRVCFNKSRDYRRSLSVDGRHWESLDAPVPGCDDDGARFDPATEPDDARAAAMHFLIDDTLNAEDRKLVYWYYDFETVSDEEFEEEFDASRAAFYQVMHRLRTRLRDAATRHGVDV